MEAACHSLRTKLRESQGQGLKAWLRPRRVNLQGTVRLSEPQFLHLSSGRLGNCEIMSVRTPGPGEEVTAYKVLSPLRLQTRIKHLLHAPPGCGIIAV